MRMNPARSSVGMNLRVKEIVGGCSAKVAEWE